MNNALDIQNNPAEYNIAIDKVGIKNVVKRIRIKKNSSSYDFSGGLSAFISLPREKRGIHMSRNPESIEEVLNEFQFKKATTFEMFVRKISETLLTKHDYSEKAEVILEGTLVLEVAQDMGGTYQKPVEIKISAISTRAKPTMNTLLTLRVTSQGINSCPCGQEMIRDYSREILAQRADRLHLTEESISNILDLIPLATHSQRGKGTIEIEERNDQIIDLLELVDIIENSMSARIPADVLKRPEEGKLVRLAHFNPKFVEDSLRLMAFQLVQKFKHLPGQTKVIFRMENMESIHVYDAFAEKTTTMNNLKDELFEAEG